MTSLRISSPATDPWQELGDLIAPLALHAPKTWGDPLRPSQMEQPQGLEAVVRYVQNNLVECPWLNHLALLAVVFYSQNIQYKSILTYLSALNRGFRDLFSAFDLQSLDQWEVNKHLPLYLGGQVLACDTSSQRIRFWRSYQAGSHHLKRWLTSLPASQQERYRPYVLPYPHDPLELTRLTEERKYYYKQQEKRKEDTGAIMPFYAELRTQAHLRYNLLTRLRKAYRQAINMVEQGQAALPVQFELREGRNVRERDSSTERLVFRLWDRRTFVLGHFDDFPYAITCDARHKQVSYTDERNSYQLEFVRAESLDGGSSPTGLWFLELLERNVLGAFPRSGSPEEIAEKQTWLRAQGYGDEEDEEGLCAPFKCSTSGLLLPSQASGDGQFMSYAQEKTRALFIPVEPLWVAATFGMVAMQILTANGMRIGELQQLRASPEGIVAITLPSPPDAPDQASRVHWAVRAVPKGKREPATYYLDDEHLRLLVLVKRMLFEHYGIDPKAGSDLPIVPMRGNNHHRFQPDRYLFQYNNVCLHEEDFRASLRFLMHGLIFQTQDERRVVIRPHLLRHGFATWALNVAKEPIDIVAKILNQDNFDVTKYYGRPTPRQVAERSYGLMNQVSSYIDVAELIVRSPEELREQLKKALQTHGTLARVRGGRCLLSGECPIFFACIGCSAKVPDPTQRGELEEVLQVTRILMERAKKKGLTLEVIQHQKKLQQCHGELQEMDMLEACREDEQREPEVNFDLDA
jgi:hypothetical protein